MRGSSRSSREARWFVRSPGRPGFGCRLTGCFWRLQQHSVLAMAPLGAMQRARRRGDHDPIRHVQKAWGRDRSGSHRSRSGLVERAPDERKWLGATRRYGDARRGQLADAAYSCRGRSRFPREWTEHPSSDVECPPGRTIRSARCPRALPRTRSRGRSSSRGSTSSCAARGATGSRAPGGAAEIDRRRELALDVHRAHRRARRAVEDREMIGQPAPGRR